MFGGLGNAVSAIAASRSQQEALRIKKAMADMRELNELQSRYRDWLKPPNFRKIGGQWFAEVEYPPSVPRVRRSHPK
jgi:hypothetical protein